MLKLDSSYLKKNIYITRILMICFRAGAPMHELVELQERNMYDKCFFHLLYYRENKKASSCSMIFANFHSSLPLQ